MPELASTMGQAIKNLGVDTFNLMGTASGGKTALWLALQAPERVLALVLEAPAAIRQEGADDLESRLPGLAAPTLVLFGTLDSVIAPTMGRVYKELMPNCHLVFVYDAAHGISADRPEAFTEVVVDFLERHEAFVIRRTATVIHP
jgi:pimeloyl-ACP methyl ester carboxylesterase